MLQHLVAERMGDKPYLQIEINEHFSKVGIVARLDAFLNSIDRYRASQTEGLPLFTKSVMQNEMVLDGDVPVAFPCIGVPGRAIGHALTRAGYELRPYGITRAAIEEGKKRSRSREYLSFSAQLGASVIQGVARPHGRHSST